MQQALIEFFTENRTDGFAALTSAQSQKTLEDIFRALDLVPTPILVGMNPGSSDIRSNAAGKALFGESNRNLSQSAIEAERPNFRVYSNGCEVLADQLPMQMAGRTGRAIEATECELRFDDGGTKF